MRPAGWRLAIARAAIALVPAAPLAAQSQSGFDYNGIVHVSWWINEYNNFDQPTGQGTDSRTALAATGANWAALLVTWYQNDAAGSITSPIQPGIIFRRPAPHIQNEEPKTPSDDALRVAIRELHSRGLKVMLKPHVDAVNGQWRGDFNPADVNGWFASYTQFIVHYAELAQAEGVEGFVMGTEFRTISGAANRDRWIAVINAIRAVYDGVLTYAANATFPGDEFTAVSFWDQLDVLGLDAYFNLTDQSNPTVAQLVSAWTSNRFGENAVANVQNFASSRGKPVIFTEIGYKSTDRANVEPWNFGLSGPVDTGEQRDCYEAAFTVWSQRTSFMKGIFWWAWPVPPPAANDGDYNPRGKPAEQVLRTWQGPAGPSFSLAASPTSLTATQGVSVTSTVNIARSGSFTGAVALTASGLPGGVTATFNPASATGTSSTLTLAAASTAATGSVTVTVTGTGGGLTRTTTVGLTVNPAATPNFTLAASPSSLTVVQGASGPSTIGIARTGGFTGAVALTASGLPSGVSAAFNPASATGASSTLTLSASASAATGTTSVTVTGAGGGLTRTTTVSLTVNPAGGGGGGTGGVTVTPVVSTSSPWFNEQQIRLNNTANVTALSITVVVQRTTGIGLNGMYNTVGGQIVQASTVVPATITYQWTLASGQTLGPATGRVFAAQTSGTGTTHPTSGDTFTVTYTTGGVVYTQTGHF